MEPVKAYSDIVVKYLLGREDTKEELRAFINAVLKDSGFDEVVSLEIKNPFTLKEFSEDKHSILDIKVCDTTGRTFNIEIQTIGNESFINRTLYYWAKIYSSQIQESEVYASLHPVICINLLNFTLFSNTQYHNCFYITEKDDPSLVLSDHLLVHFLEMPKIQTDTMSTDLERWLQYFINEGQGDDVMEPILKDDPLFQRVHSEYKKFTADERLRDMYEARLKHQRDYNQLLYSAKKEGREKGIEEGIEHERRETARKMLAEGFDTKQIEKITGLTEHDISTLGNE